MNGSRLNVPTSAAENTTPNAAGVDLDVVGDQEPARSQDLSLAGGLVYAVATPAPIPPPASAWLLIGGAAALAGMARRRR